MKGVAVRGRAIASFVLSALLAGLPFGASAHSASDAYLTLDVGDGSVARLQWDVALRDLDFVMRLDDDGDGRITWKELRRHQDAIGRYAMAHIAFRRGTQKCSARLVRQLVDEHADGSYAALFVDIACPRSTGSLALDYSLFFDIDPSHRAILVSRHGSDTATALISPANATVTLDGDAARSPKAPKPPR